MVARNPYVGPAAIAEGTPLYGRAAEKRDLCRLLVTERIVLLYSPSGAGKSSLIQAGVLPQLRREPGLRLFLIKGLRGGDAGARLGVKNRYLASLIEQLEAALPEGLRGRFDWGAPAASLRGYLDWLRGAGAERDRPEGQVLILDHFEDVLLDPYDRQDKQTFFRELGQALTDRSRYALLSMGERHIAELDEYLHFVPTSLARRFRLGLLGRRQAREAVICPAGALQVEYQPRAVVMLVNRLRLSTEQHGAGGAKKPAVSEWVEPVQLQVVCHRLWEAKFASLAEPGGLITEADVEALSIDSALEDYYADTAKAAALAAGIPEREVREWIEDRLILSSGARAQALRADTARLLSSAAIEVLLAKHLVLLQMLGDSRWFELAYDRLVQPIRRDNLRWFARNLAPLQLRARQWDLAKNPPQLLLSVSEWWKTWRWKRAHYDDLSGMEREFWARSLRRLRSRVGIRVAMLFVLLSTAISVLERFRTQDAEDARRQQQMLVKLGHAKQMASGLSLDHALIEGAGAAKEVAQLPQGISNLLTNLSGRAPESSVRERLRFSVRDSLLSVLRAVRDVRSVIVHDDVRLKAVAVRPADGLFAYGGTGKVRFVYIDAEDKVRFSPPGTSEVDVACAKKAEDNKEKDVDVQSLAFNRQGTLLALGCASGTVEVWSTSNWKRADYWQAHDVRTWAVAFDSGGTLVASVSDVDKTIKVMSLNPDGTRKLENKLEKMNEPKSLKVPEATGGFWSIAFSPIENSRLVAGDGNRGLWLCDLGDRWKCESKGQVEADDTKSTKNAVLAVAFSPDGACIAAGSWEGKVSLWDSKLSSGEEVATETGLAVLSLAFTKRHELAVGWANRLRFTPLKDSSCQRNAGSARDKLFGDEVAAVAFHEGSGFLAAATASGYLALIDAGIRKAVVPQEVRSEFSEKSWGWRGALASDDGIVSRLVIGRVDLDKLFVVNIPIPRVGVPYFDSSVAAGQGGGVQRVTASVSGKRVATLGRDGSIKFWKLAAKLEPDPNVLPAERAVWKLANDAANHEKQQLPFSISASVQRVLLSPRDNLLACMFTNGVLMINLADQSYKWVPLEGMAAREIAFSNDGALFAVGGDQVLVWDVSAGEIKLRKTGAMTLGAGLAGNVTELAFATTRDGRVVVIAGSSRNGQLLVWDAKTGDPLQTLSTDSRAVFQMAFLTSKNLLAAADSFGRITLWDTSFGSVTLWDTLRSALFGRVARSTGEWPRAELTSQTEAIQRPRLSSFALNGRFLVRGDDDLMIWDIDEEALRRTICDILARPRDVSERVTKACEEIRY